MVGIGSIYNDGNMRLFDYLIFNLFPATSLCRAEGMKCLRRNQLGRALEWAFRSQDSAFASHLADQFLQQYVKQGAFDSDDFLDNLGSCMLICDRLTFLGEIMVLVINVEMSF